MTGCIPVLSAACPEVIPPTAMKATAKQIGLLLLAAAALAVMANVVHPRRIPWVQDWSRQVEKQAEQRGVRMVSPAVALELFRSGNVTFIDARPEAEFLNGHIPGAVSVPFGQLDEKIPQIMRLIDSGHVLVIYCSNRMCDDALLLAAEIKAMGGDALLFIDGFDSWAKHGAEVEQ